jgi:hypothetical protein
LICSRVGIWCENVISRRHREAGSVFRQIGHDLVAVHVAFRIVAEIPAAGQVQRPVRSQQRV